MNRFSLTSLPLEQKTVFLRVDFNVPLSGSSVLDDRKIQATLPTIEYLLEKNCKIIIATHLGRPEGKIVGELRVAPVVKALHKLLPKIRITGLHDCLGQTVRSIIAKGKTREIFFLENLRFYQEEEENDPTFAHALASLADIYVNDAFGLYSKHASVVAITQFLPSAAGFLLEHELQQLSKALHPQHPAIWLMGGAKLSKVDLIKQALKKADNILIGGALAFAFLRAKGFPVGQSKIDHDSIFVAKQILKKRIARRKIILPVDFVATTTFSPNAKAIIVPFDQIPSNVICLDLGPQTIELFKRHLRQSRTIVWNGPLGYFEWAKFATATREIGRFISKLTATSICGGGETGEAIERYHLEQGITHVSTGGGASILFLSGKRIAAITALEESYKKFRKRVKKQNLSY